MSAGYLVVAICCLWVATGLVMGWVMGRRGHDPFSWGVVGVLLGPVGIAFAHWARQDALALARRSAPPLTGHRGPVDVLAGLDGFGCRVETVRARCSAMEVGVVTGSVVSRQAARTSRARHRIVVGVDGSPCAERALRWASDEAALRRSGLEVVCCWLDPVASRTGTMEPGDPSVRDAHRVVEAAGRIARSRGYQLDIQLRVINGDPGPELIARSEDAALLVVGRWGVGEAEVPLLGSVSAYCLQHALCPVEVVPLVLDAITSRPTSRPVALTG
jgi:nucleotide-binding universal stress UspA family protein